MRSRPARRLRLVAPAVAVSGVLSFLLPALLLALLPGTAAARWATLGAPAISARPGAAPAGMTVTVTGELPECSEPDSGDTFAEVLFDGTSLVRHREPGSHGTFTAAVVIPAATTGQHELAARCWYESQPSGVVLVTRSFLVVDPSLTASPPDGHPGDEVEATGSQWQVCDLDGQVVVELLWDGRSLGTVDAGPDGAFTRGFTVPAGAGPGPHQVGARCAGFGDVLDTVTFTVARPAVPSTRVPGTPTVGAPASATASAAETPTAGPATASPTSPPPAPAVTTPPAATDPEAVVRAPRTERRAWVPATLPQRLDTTAGDLVRSFALAVLLVLLVGFPAELFNQTVADNAPRIRRALGRLPRPGLPRLPGAASLAAFTVVAALLTAFADPGQGLDRASLLTVVGLLVAIPVTLLAFEVPVELWCRRHCGDRAPLRALPFALVVAGVLALVSRVAGFQPAYVYGLIAGYAVLATRALTRDRAGQAVLAGAASLLAVSLLAWAGWHAVGGPDGTLASDVADSVLGAVALVGVEGLVFALVPLRFLDGEALWQWGRARWAAAYVVAAFVFVHVLLTSRTDRIDAADVARMLGLFVAFGAASVAFWAWFRFRPAPAEA